MRFFPPALAFTGTLLCSLAWAGRIVHIPSKEAAQAIGLDLLQRAQAGDEIFISRFSLQNDITGRSVLTALVRAAQRGARVKFLFNSVTSNPPRDLCAYAQSQGVELREFSPFAVVGAIQALRNYWRADSALTLGQELSGVQWKHWNPQHTQRHMHDKVTYVRVGDRTYSIIGGRNVTDSDLWHPLRGAAKLDSDVLLESLSVNSEIRSHYLDLWESSWVKELKQVALNTEQIQGLKTEMRQLDQVLAQIEARNPVSKHLELPFEVADEKIEFLHDTAGKKNEFNGTTARLLDFLNTAQHSIAIESPYLILDEQGRRVFAAAVKRGVKFTLITNSKISTDEPLPQSVYEIEKERYVAMGLELHEYIGPRTLHAKRIVIDKRWVYIGSFNFNSRALLWDLETGLIFDDPAFAQFITQEIAGTLAHSRRITRREAAQGACESTLLGSLAQRVRMHL